MEIKVLKEVNNPLLHRKEIRFEIRHSGAATPDRLSIRQAVASKLKADSSKVYVIDAITATGSQTTTGRADVYQEVGDAQIFLPQHILTRNLPPEQRPKAVAEEKKPEPAEEPKKAEPKPSKPKREEPEKAAEQEAEKEKPSGKAKD